MKTFKSDNANDVAVVLKYIQMEFVSTLHTTRRSDEEIRSAMLTHGPIRDFADKYSTIFEKITTREIATNPILMTPILQPRNPATPQPRNPATPQPLITLTPDNPNP